MKTVPPPPLRPAGLLSLPDVAARTGLSLQSVRGHVYRGRLVAQLYRGEPFVNQADLAAWQGR